MIIIVTFNQCIFHYLSKIATTTVIVIHFKIFQTQKFRIDFICLKLLKMDKTKNKQVTKILVYKEFRRSSKKMSCCN